jgi:hypothetical protein
MIESATKTNKKHFLFFNNKIILLFLAMCLYAFSVVVYCLYLFFSSVIYAEDISSVRCFEQIVYNICLDNWKRCVETSYDRGLTPEYLQRSPINILARILTFSMGERYEWSIYVFTQEKENKPSDIEKIITSNIMDMDKDIKNALSIRKYHIYFINIYPKPEIIPTQELNKEGETFFDFYVDID